MVDPFVQKFNFSPSTVRIIRRSILLVVSFSFLVSAFLKNKSLKPLIVPIRVAIITGRAGKGISRNLIMLPGKAICVIVLMTIDATKNRKITLCRMAFYAVIPLIFMFSAKNWEILLVVKIGRLPSFFGVARLTISRKSCTYVIGVAGGIVVIRMAAKAGIGCITKAVGMASRAVVCNISMRIFQHIKIIVIGKFSRSPSNFGRVAICTICRKI